MQKKNLTLNKSIRAKNLWSWEPKETKETSYFILFSIANFKEEKRPKDHHYVITLLFFLDK